MKRNLPYFSAVIGLLFCISAKGQVTTQPSPAVESKAVTLTFDATKGDGGLANYSGSIYAHIGVITNKSTSGSDWKYVKADWPNGTNSATVNQDAWKLTATSTANIYTLSISPSIRSYFGVPAGETVNKIAIVFRNADGSKTGKASGSTDVFVDVVQSDIALIFSTPTEGMIYTTADNIPIKASANAAKMEVYINNTLTYTQNSGTLSYSYQAPSSGSYVVKVVAYDESGNTDTIQRNISVISAPVVEALPSGMKAGLNIVNGKATFVLQTPGKKLCTLLGSFNSYQVSDTYTMKVTPDGQFFWITLDNLQNSTDYSYQYLVDGKIRVADPYSSLVLDPWNDSYITAETYPNMPVYPTGLTTGIVSSFRINPETYSWQSAAFTPVSHEKLNIYEVLVRDFIAKHDYKTLTDTLKYFKNMGVNAIELMPVNEFEGNSSWGYNPSFYFAVDKYYGPANDLKRFIDECHKQGIAVIMDMVLNHSFGQSPLVQLYYDSGTSKVTSDNPWYNVNSPNSTYSWGFDFNHESKYTQSFVDSVNAYWMNEFKVDGYRFDFTKGFTQTPGDGWAYDAARIAILKRMNAEIKKRNPNAIVIFEHLAENSEEKELSDAGILLWGNINNNSCEGAMGFTESSKSDLTWASYKARTWNNPNVVAYMESHDEERVGYKQATWGAVNGSYNVKDLTTATQRHAALATVFMSIPGPKMIWQWQELGYDHSINECENGTVDANGGCRTSPKPAFWDKNTNTAANQPRLELKNVFTKMMEFRNKYPVFSTTNFKDSLTGTLKYIKLNGSEMNVVSLANFGVTSGTIKVPVAETGYYYSYFSKDSVKVENGKITKTLAAGEYHLYTSVRLFKPLKLEISAPVASQKYYVNESITISATTVAPKSTLYINGEKIADFNGNISYSYTPAQVGSYTIKVVAADGEDSETKSVTIAADYRPISITIDSPENNASYLTGDNVSISASATNATSVTLYIDGQQVSSGSTSVNYTFIPVKAGTVYIKINAANSATSKDSIISITVKAKMKESSFGPNPVKLNEKIEFNPNVTKQGSATLSVYTLNGKLVHTSKLTLVPNTNISLNTFSIGMTKQGFYLVRIVGDGVNIKEKIIVL